MSEMLYNAQGVGLGFLLLSAFLLSGFTVRCLDESNDSFRGTRIKCKEPKTEQEERFFKKLSSKKADLRERNRVIYAEFPFYRTTWVLGWAMRGKAGNIRGSYSDQPGIITEYVILYLNLAGKWSFINNSRSGNEVFRNEGNLARPDAITKVELAIPIQTNMLRIFPQLWDGVPFVRISINYCQEPDPTPPASPVTQSPPPMLENLWPSQSFESDTGQSQKTVSIGKESYPFEKSEKQKLNDFMKTSPKPGNHNCIMISTATPSLPPSSNNISYTKLFSLNQSNTDFRNPPKPQNNKQSKPYKVDPFQTGNSISNPGRHVSQQKPVKLSPKESTASKQRNSSLHIKYNMQNMTRSNRKKTTNYEKLAMAYNPVSHRIYDEYNMSCSNIPQWRYSYSASIPKDIFTSTDDSFQAWRAMYGSSPVPYLFNTTNKRKTRKRNLQVSFQTPVTLSSIRIVGSHVGGKWGLVTKFSLFHKLGAQRWKYYTDSNSRPTVFDIGQRQKKTVGIPATFQLPLPIRVTDIRLVPEQWVGMPYISVNFKACMLQTKTKGNNCSVSLLKETKKMKRLIFDHLSRKTFYRNKKFKELTFSHNAPLKVTGMTVLAPDLKPPKTSVVTKFVLQYLSPDGKWKTIKKKAKYAWMFSVTRKARSFKFYPIISALALRIFPEKWSGKSPELLIDVIGCPT